MKKIVLLIVLGVFAIVALICLLFNDKSFLSFNESQKTYKIVEKWELPEELNEISGLSWIGNGRIACIQDEDATIFIYNLSSSRITSTIDFGTKGDFEAIAVNGQNAYVMRSDGRIFEIIDYAGKNIKVNEYQTSLENRDVEGMALDIAKNRLLLTVKEVPHNEKDFKGIYAFDLTSKELLKDPVFRIRIDDPIFEGLQGHGSQRVIRPSEIERNPVTGDWYLLEGHQPKIIILDSVGDAKQIYVLDPKEFQQAEGLTFSTDGTLFISNESRRAPANILKIELTPDRISL
ncbi:SdiA-regulated domain-containing protein [Autumnicola musiva]|uniref:SdiA-regulated domain-containing protein n=1 Tax=Autumnicola musiva TaxID=3075589 RepID=A0ABU3D7E7_9FLAO|nr:SdiA-regulated domain-containing protein [Zunongwangia sp. F117]MDT0676923.1 SdiA-regulated domain-containing protein [Zunongwangia sp. F117]